MTRLKSEDIRDIGDDWVAYEAELQTITGRGLAGVAAHAAGIDTAAAAERLAALAVWAVPMTCGQGVIGGFSRAVARIAGHLGCRAHCAAQSDAAGLAEAFENGADLILLSDDSRFVAIDAARRQVVDNGAATGTGFAAGLDLMAGGLTGRTIVVMGCGPVGRAAAAAAASFGASVRLHDLKPDRCRRAVDDLKQQGVQAGNVAGIEEALDRHRLIIEATNSPDTIPAARIHADTRIAAPGVPLGLDRRARTRAAGRLLHDPLEIGVATMLTLALAARPTS